MNDATEVVPADLIPTSAACKLIPSPRPGKQTNLATLYRWMAAGKLRWWRNGRYRLVSRAEVLALLKPESAPARTKAPGGHAAYEESARAIAASTARILEQARI